MTVDEVVDFLQAYIALEAQTERARLTQSEDYRPLRKQAARMWADPGNSVAFLPIYGEPTDADKLQLRQHQQRKLFKASRYAHPDLGEIVQCVVSADSTAWGAHGYHARYDVAARDGALKIVADYQFCPSCFCTGKSGGAACRECGATGWKYVRGVKHPSLGEPLEVRRLTAPDDPRSQAAHALDR